MAIWQLFSNLPFKTNAFLPAYSASMLNTELNVSLFSHFITTSILTLLLYILNNDNFILKTFLYSNNSVHL